MHAIHRALRRSARVLLVFGLTASAGALVRAQGQPAVANVVSLSASAMVEVANDLLSVTFSTTREGADAGAVQRQLQQDLEAAVAQARSVSKPGQVDVQTGNFALQPRYAAPSPRNASGQPGQINGWQGRVELVVEGRDTQAIAQLAGRITTLSIARVSQGLSREARERAEAETSAQAISRFRERAKAYAKLFGFAGFEVREVQVSSQEPPRYMATSAMRVMSAPGQGADAALPVEAGKASVTSSVSGSVQMLK